jgi:hypothetical protein
MQAIGHSARSCAHELLIDPMSAIVASPHSSAHEPASDRPSWNDDLPQMPDFRPCWFRARQARILNILVITAHHFVRSVGVGRTSFDRLAIALTRTCSRSRCSSRNCSASSLGVSTFFGFLSGAAICNTGWSPSNKAAKRSMTRDGFAAGSARTLGKLSGKATLALFVDVAMKLVC